MCTKDKVQRTKYKGQSTKYKVQSTKYKGQSTKDKVQRTKYKGKNSSVVQLFLASLASSQHSLALQAWFRFQVSSEFTDDACSASSHCSVQVYTRENLNENCKTAKLQN